MGYPKGLQSIDCGYHHRQAPAAQGIVRRIKKLECIAGGIDIAGKSQKGAAEQSVSVLNGLHKLLTSAAEDATPDGMQPSILIAHVASSRSHSNLHYSLATMHAKFNV